MHDRVRGSERNRFQQSISLKEKFHSPESNIAAQVHRTPEPRMPFTQPSTTSRPARVTVDSNCNTASVKSLVKLLCMCIKKSHSSTHPGSKYVVTEPCATTHYPLRNRVIMSHLLSCSSSPHLIPLSKDPCLAPAYH